MCLHPSKKSDIWNQRLRQRKRVKSKWFKPSFKAKITDLLCLFEEYGGQEAYKMIKKKVPTYMSIHAF